MEERDMCLQLVAFALGPATEIVQHCFEVDVLYARKIDNKQFLDNLQNKHVLFHQFIPTISCCECVNYSMAALHKHGCLKRSQFFQLYDNTGVSKHEIKKANEITQHCLCKFSSKLSATVDNLDITMLYNIIKRCCPSTRIDTSLLQDIKDVRNFVVHIANGEIKTLEFKKYWKKLESATLGLAEGIGSTCIKRFRRDICQLKKSSVEELIKTVKESTCNINEIVKEFNGLKFQSILDVLDSQQKVDTTRHATVVTSLGKMEEKMDYLTTRLQILESNQTLTNDAVNNSQESSKERISIKCEAESQVLDDNKAAQYLLNNKTVCNADSLKIESVDTKCLLLQLSSSRDIFKDEDSLHFAIRSLIKRIIEAGEMNTSADSAMDIKLTFTSSITDEERDMVRSMLSKYQSVHKMNIHHDLRVDEAVSICRKNENEATVVPEEIKSVLTSNVLCCQCRYQDKLKYARKWCSNCKTGFCEECEEVHISLKNSRNHRLISLMDFPEKKEEVADKICLQHGKNYDLYCPIHGKPLCISCFEKHKSCFEIPPLNVDTKRVKHLPALADLEDTIKGAIHSVENCIQNNESNEDEQNLKKYIKEIREKLNKYLDSLERKLRADLFTKSENYKTLYGMAMLQLKLAHENLSYLKEESKVTKQIASDTNMISGTNEFSKIVEMKIHSSKSKDIADRFLDTNIEQDSGFTSLQDLNSPLASTSIMEARNDRFQVTKPNLKLSQMEVSVPAVRFINLVQTLRIKQDSALLVTGCIILPNGNLLKADYYDQKIIVEYFANGKHARNIQVSGYPYDLTYIYPDCIAVTYGCSSDTLDVIHVRKGVIEKKIPIESLVAKRCIHKDVHCFGISYHDGKLFVIVNGIGIILVDRSGKVLDKIKIDTVNVRKIAVVRDKIYYTNRAINTIYCLSINGEEIWVYHNASIVELSGVAVASNLDLFVIGSESNKLLLIKGDGKSSKVLLQEDDGLIKPNAIHYNRERNELLVWNMFHQYAAIFKVI